MKKIVCILAAVIAIGGCSTSSSKKASQIPDNKIHDVPDEDYKAHADQGLFYVQAGKLNLAIIEFDEAIKQCEAKYPAIHTKIFTSRTTAESLMYTMLAATKKEPAEVVELVCSDVYYLRGFAALNTGRVRDAEVYLKKAVNMAPVNAMYLSALGRIYQVRGDWNQAVEYFTRAEDAATTYSPENVRVSEFLRAKRGIGFNLIQLGKLDEAEKKYKEYLLVDAEDRNALGELEYIKIIRDKKNL